MEKVKLTEAQRQWYCNKLEGFECIFVGIHGSLLYGLDHEGSDIDLKAIYLPSKRDLIKGIGMKTYNHKNDELDIEIEIKSILSFLKSAGSCDTNCIDLLHTPDELILNATIMWDQLQEHRKDLYAKNMKGMVGYIKTHSKKYTNKIDRLNEMKDLLPSLSTYPDYTKLGSVTPRLDLSKFKFIKLVLRVCEGDQPYLEVCGKKYLLSASVGKLKEALQAEIKRYGKRSNSGTDKGIDSKSLSHALRVLLQLKEILITNDLKFPLEDACFVNKVKLGEINDVKIVMDHIDKLYEECMMLIEQSELQEEPCISNMEKIVEDHYFN